MGSDQPVAGADVGADGRVVMFEGRGQAGDNWGLWKGCGKIREPEMLDWSLTGQ